MRGARVRGLARLRPPDADRMDRPAAHVPAPTSIVVHGRSRVLEIGFEDGASYRIPFELMRVLSPSAEVQGHSPDQKQTVAGKREVGIVAVEPIGHYAVRIRFTDGHDTGIYSWALLRKMGQEQAALWDAYLAALAQKGLSRDP